MRCKAFTLAEVMVVVAILALLLMILAPSLNRTLGMARSTLCRNNLAKISTAFGTYVGGVDGSGAAAAHPPDSGLWPGVPYSVCPSKNLFICPEKEEKSSFSLPTNPLDGLVYVHRVRGFEVPFAEVGLGKMHFGTRRGSDARGEYIECGTDDNSACTAAYMDRDGHDGIIRIYLMPNGEIIAKLMKYSCGESNCVLYKGKPLFPDNVYTTPGEERYGWLGPGTSKNGMEVVLAKGMKCSYGINERSGELRNGTNRVLLVDYDQMVVKLGDPKCPEMLAAGAARHMGKLNMLRVDGRVQAMGPTQLDPLLGDQNLWEP